MPSPNHYRILEINNQASHQEIKQAYRRLVKQFHPDSKQQTASHERIVEINAAYEVLGDPKRRQVYDYQLDTEYVYPQTKGRQERTAEAQERYHRYREAQPDTDAQIKYWYKRVYVPIVRLIRQIIQPLDAQIDQLAADPFDDRLMSEFQFYLKTCHRYLDKAKQIFSSQPNPAKLAKIAASVYHCLNHISDGIEELEFFTLNYDDHSLHTGKEMFRLADRLRKEAQNTAARYCG